MPRALTPGPVAQADDKQRILEGNYFFFSSPWRLLGFLLAALARACRRPPASCPLFLQLLIVGAPPAAGISTSGFLFSVTSAGR
jgi:hypothetical protein